MAKVIVTGGAGFIGSHLVDTLLEKGFEIHAIDSRRKNVSAGIYFHKADIRDFRKIAPLFKGAKFIFHLAALPRVQPSIQDPKTSHDINVNGTLNVLIAARDAGVKRVIYSASSSAYGNQEKLPLTEDMAPAPLSPYGLQKYIGELYCRMFSSLYGLETVCLRYFNVYGPRASAKGAYALVTARFLEQKKKGEPLTIVPDGHQSRDFTHVKDVVRANLLAAKSSKVGKGEVINIGAGRNYSVLEVADMIGGPKIFIEPRIEPRHTLADISKAWELIRWKPRIKMEDGIAEIKSFAGLN